MSLTKVINTTIKESEITGDKINVAGVLTFNTKYARYTSNKSLFTLK